jgi:hypothetical protein
MRTDDAREHAGERRALPRSALPACHRDVAVNMGRYTAEYVFNQRLDEARAVLAEYRRLFPTGSLAHHLRNRWGYRSEHPRYLEMIEGQLSGSPAGWPAGILRCERRAVRTPAARFETRAHASLCAPLPLTRKCPPRSRCTSRSTPCSSACARPPARRAG